MDAPNRKRRLKEVDDKIAVLKAEGRTLDAIHLMEEARKRVCLPAAPRFSHMPHPQSLEHRMELHGPNSASVLQQCKDLSDSLNGVALRYLQSEDLEAAYGLLRKAEVLTGNDDLISAVTYNNLACYYRRKGRLRIALQYLQRALRIETNSNAVVNPAGTRLNLCAVLSQLGKHEEALQHAQASVILLQEELVAQSSSVDLAVAHKTSPELLNKMAVLSISYHNMGVEHEHLKSIDSAVDAYQKGADIARFYLGDVNQITKTLSKSLADAKSMLAAPPTKPKPERPHSALGPTYEKLKMMREREDKLEHSTRDIRLNSSSLGGSAAATPAASRAPSASRVRASSATVRASSAHRAHGGATEGTPAVQLRMPSGPDPHLESVSRTYKAPQPALQAAVRAKSASKLRPFSALESSIHGKNTPSWLNAHLDSNASSFNESALRAGGNRPISALAYFNPSRSTVQQQQHSGTMPTLGRTGPRTPPDDEDWDQGGRMQQSLHHQPRQYTNSFQAPAGTAGRSSRPISAVTNGSSRPVSAVPNMPPRSSSASARSTSMSGFRGRGAGDDDVDAFVQEADEDAVGNDDWDTLGGARMAASRAPPVDMYRRYSAPLPSHCNVDNDVRRLIPPCCSAANVAGTDLGAIKGSGSGKPAAAQMRTAPCSTHSPFPQSCCSPAFHSVAQLEHRPSSTSWACSVCYTSRKMPRAANAARRDRSAIILLNSLPPFARQLMIIHP
jgi:tetratricopeptide (TPR) repeat protein